MHERTGHGQTLAHTAGELRGAFADVSLEMCRLNELIPAFLKFLIAETVKLPREKQVLIHRQLVIERKLLRHITDHFLDRFSFADDIVATDSRRSFRRLQNPTKHADDGRFAGTVRPEKTKNRSLAN